MKPVLLIMLSVHHQENMYFQSRLLLFQKKEKSKQMENNYKTSNKNEMPIVDLKYSPPWNLLQSCCWCIPLLWRMKWQRRGWKPFSDKIFPSFIGTLAPAPRTPFLSSPTNLSFFSLQYWWRVNIIYWSFCMLGNNTELKWLSKVSIQIMYLQPLGPGCYCE